MSVAENYFALFGLPEDYGLDVALLADKYRLLQRNTHPDRFAGASKQEQLLSAQYAAVVNDAYESLKSPVKRAIYMLKLKGLNLDEQRSANMSPDFLMRQIELREELEGVKDQEDSEAALEKLNDNLQGQLSGFEQAFAASINCRADDSLNNAVQTVNKMQFIVKMLKDVERLEDELLDY